MSVQPMPEERITESGTSAVADPDSHVRTQFLRRIAHDIASPTGVTLTVLDELMAEGKARPELVAMARRSLKRLMRLSEQLAIVAELEGEALEPELDTVDIRATLKQALDDALGIDGRKDVVAACDLPAAQAFVSADRRRAPRDHRKRASLGELAGRGHAEAHGRSGRHPRRRRRPGFL
jgi:signal transduction histidine kinase